MSEDNVLEFVAIHGGKDPVSVFLSKRCKTSDATAIHKFPPAPFVWRLKHAEQTHEKPRERTGIIQVTTDIDTEGGWTS